MKCIHCKAQVKEKKVRVIELGVDIGKFDAFVCDNCGEEYYSSEVVRQIQKKEKEAGIWGLSSTTKIGESGNALMIRLTKRLAEFMKLKKGQEVEIEPKGPGQFLVKVVET